MEPIRNTSWRELNVGATASLEPTCAVQDLFLFAHTSGNTNPLMLPAGTGDDDSSVKAVVAPSMWVGSLVSAVLGNLLPGPGTLYRFQSFRFLRRVKVGDRLTVSVTCTEKGEAARTKGIASRVAGWAEVLTVPNLEAGNMLAKELSFVVRAQAAGLVVGAAAPIILTSRADDDRARLASCALAQLYDHWRREGAALGA